MLGIQPSQPALQPRALDPMCSEVQTLEAHDKSPPSGSQLCYPDLSYSAFLWVNLGLWGPNLMT